MIVAWLFFFYVMAVSGVQVFKVYQPGRNTKEGCNKLNGCNQPNKIDSGFSGVYILEQARYVISWDILRPDLLEPGDKVAVEIIKDTWGSDTFWHTIAWTDPNAKRYIWSVQDTPKLGPKSNDLYIFLSVIRNNQRSTSLNSNSGATYEDGQFNIELDRFQCDSVTSEFRYNCPCRTDADCNGQYASLSGSKTKVNEDKRPHCAVYAMEGFDYDGQYRKHTRTYCALDSSIYGYLCPLFDYQYSPPTNVCWQDNVYSSASCYRGQLDYHQEWDVCERSIWQWPSFSGSGNCHKMCTRYPGVTSSQGTPPPTPPMVETTAVEATEGTVADAECSAINSELGISVPSNSLFCTSLRLGRCDESGRFETVRFCDRADDCKQAVIDSFNPGQLLLEAYCVCPSNYVSEPGTGQCVCPAGLVSSVAQGRCVEPYQTTVPDTRSDSAWAFQSASQSALRRDVTVDVIFDDGGTTSLAAGSRGSSDGVSGQQVAPVSPGGSVQSPPLPDWLWGAVAGGAALYLLFVLGVVFCCVRASQERKLTRPRKGSGSGSSGRQLSMRTTGERRSRRSVRRASSRAMLGASLHGRSSFRSGHDLTYPSQQAALLQQQQQHHHQQERQQQGLIYPSQQQQNTQPAYPSQQTAAMGRSRDLPGTKAYNGVPGLPGSATGGSSLSAAVGADYPSAMEQRRAAVAAPNGGQFHVASVGAAASPPVVQPAYVQPTYNAKSPSFY